ncbi:MAG: DUF2569 family protein [bacterium]|nr:DUF2569 family protein [bacterium]MDI1336823.1 DUF2569 family protein [Lacunisphaera sp.]
MEPSTKSSEGNSLDRHNASLFGLYVGAWAAVYYIAHIFAWPLLGKGVPPSIFVVALVAFLAALLVGGIAFICALLFQGALARAKGAAVSTTEPIGIGGWLIIAILGTMGAIVATAYGLYGSYQRLSDHGYNLVFNQQGDLLQNERILIYVAAVVSASAIVAGLVGLRRIFTSSPKTGMTMIVHSVFVVFASVVDVLQDQLVSRHLHIERYNPDAYTRFVSILFLGVIGIGYFIKSKRVRNTFAKQHATSG